MIQRWQSFMDRLWIYLMMIIESGVPCIVARGRKGGSNVAAAIINALMYMITDRDK